jgi:Ca-activated chloride channel homolog
MARFSQNRRAHSRWGVLAILAITAMLPACLISRKYILNNPPGFANVNQPRSQPDPDARAGKVKELGSFPGLPPETPNTESYAHYKDNDFLTVSRNPLSTFSIDVDTASYSNVRRMLNDGKLPPKDAVRIAELVNYFNYAYPEPQRGHPVGMAVDGAPCPWNTRHQLVRVALKAKAFTAENMPPRNFVFLVDVSGSMDNPMKLPLVQSSLRLFVERLTSDDRVSIVTYAGDTSVRLTTTPGNDKRTILRAIDGLTPGGSTNGASGIERAYEQAQSGFMSNGVNRVILCTDGDFNVGITSEGDLVRLIEKKRDHGIFLTVLGYGMGNLNDSTMQKLAHHGDGHYAYVDSLEEARKLFVEQGGALACVAKDVKIQVEFNPARVSAYRLIGYENRLLKAEDFKNDKKDAGDMGSGQAVTALYEVIPTGESIDGGSVDALKYQRDAKPLRNNSDEWLTVKLRYKQPDGGASMELAAVLGDKNILEAVELNHDLEFAACVATFGMILRDSPHKGSANYKSLLESLEHVPRLKVDTPRQEFVRLVEAARKLDREKTR